jgi:hypothetical protein
MTTSDTTPSWAISFQIPAYWTPEQAFAVYELLSELRERIWSHYELQLVDQCREQQGSMSIDHSDQWDDDPDDPPF